MPKRAANARWEGDLAGGNGTMELGGGAWTGPYSAKSRFEEGDGTNPEELIAAAHAGCYAMALSGDLTAAGFKPEVIRASAKVHLDMAGGVPTIALIELTVGAKVPGVDNAKFQEIAAGTKMNCPVSRALSAVKIDLDATLES